MTWSAHQELKESMGQLQNGIGKADEGTLSGLTTRLAKAFKVYDDRVTPCDRR